MIVFLPSNEYHTETMARIVPHLDAADQAAYVFADLGAVKREGASEAIARLGLPSIPYEEEYFSSLTPGDAVVVLNDWSPWERNAVVRARQRCVATIGMVEGAQDYLDTHIEEHARAFPPRYPYMTVAERLLLGPFDSGFIPGIITGCPRFDDLFGPPPTLPAEPTVCIHSNFTYGLYEDVRDWWVREAVDAAVAAGWNYYVAAHPRDRGDFSAYRRHPSGKLHEEITACHLVITRFSSIIFDILLMGRLAMYYNPHGERQPTMLDGMGAYDIIGDLQELGSRLRSLRAQFGEFSADLLRQRPVVTAFLEHHLGPLDGKAGVRAGATISRLARQYNNLSGRVAARRR